MNRPHRLACSIAFAAVAVALVGPVSLAGQPASGDSVDGRVEDDSAARYEEWVRTWIDSWEKRDVHMVFGLEWRGVADGRTLLEALRHTDLPVAEWERHPRFSGRICARTRSSGQCTTVSYMSHERTGELLELPPTEIEAVLWIGPTVSSESAVPRMAWDAQLAVERVILFSRGYLPSG
ncbi:MAG: hypothetical protein AAF389_10465 [Gemmatimonadota bacterium]